MHANNAAFYPLFFHVPSFPPHFVVFLNFTSTTRHPIAITVLRAVALLFADRRPSKRVRFDDSQSPYTPLSNRTYAPPAQGALCDTILSDCERSSAESPPRLSKADMQASIARAFEPFKQYIEYLATGKLDGYLDSVHREDKFTVPGLVMSTDPHLLLHNLGKYPDEERIERLFYPGTTSVILNYTWPIISNCLLTVRYLKPRVLARPVYCSRVSAIIGDFIFHAPPNIKGPYPALAISRPQLQHCDR